MPHKYKVEGREDLVRDASTGAIISVSGEKIRKERARKAKIAEREREIESIKERLSVIEKKLGI